MNNINDDDDDDDNNNINPRKDGGRELMQIGAYITEATKLKEYVEHTDDPLMQIVRTHQHNTSSTLFHTATTLQKSLQIDKK
jgi:hypothetical protein